MKVGTTSKPICWPATTRSVPARPDSAWPRLLLRFRSIPQLASIFGLGVQGQSTQVTVTDETPQLKVDRADVSTTLTTDELGGLPILNRNVTQMLLVTPGTQLNDWTHAAAENPQGGYQIDVNGQQFTSNGFLLDGTENNSAILGIAVVNPNIDSLQEFKVTTSNYDAQFGSVAGALLQATTKSGTNNLHGSLFEYLRNDTFNAKDRFSALNLPLRWNQFGGSFGGPIMKRQVVLFRRLPRHAQTPRCFHNHDGANRSRAQRRSDRSFGKLHLRRWQYLGNRMRHPSNLCRRPKAGLRPLRPAWYLTRPRAIRTEANARQLRPTVRSMSFQFRPLSLIFLQFLPMPNTNPGSIANNYIASGSEKFDSDQVDGRIDYNFSDKLHFFGRYTIADFDLSAPGAYGTEAGGPASERNQFRGQFPRPKSEPGARQHIHIEHKPDYGFSFWFLSVSNSCPAERSRHNTGYKCGLARFEPRHGRNQRDAGVLYQRKWRI